MTWTKPIYEPYGLEITAPPVRRIQDYLLEDIGALTEDDQYVYMPTYHARSPEYIERYGNDDPAPTPFYHFAKRAGWEINDDALPLVRIPKTHAALKDREFDEYRRLYSELMKKRKEYGIKPNGYYDTMWYNNLTTKALKNILKSQNIKKALTDLNNFVADYSGQIRGHKFDSLNQIRDYPTKHNAAQSIYDRLMSMTDAQLDEVFGTTNYEDIIPTDEWYFLPEDGVESSLKDIVTSIEALETRFPGYLEKIPSDVADEASDFTHVPIVEDVLQKLRDLFEQGHYSNSPGNWRVLKNKQDMLDSGKSLALCYGDIERYGPEHHKKYMRQARNNRSIFLTNGTSTAELEPVIDRDGTIKEVGVGQIQGYKNTNKGVQPGTEGQLREIARQLKGRKFEVSDKYLKMIKYFEEHDWDQQPRIINAINRRF